MPLFKGFVFKDTVPLGGDPVLQGLAEHKLINRYDSLRGMGTKEEKI